MEFQPLMQEDRGLQVVADQVVVLDLLEVLVHLDKATLEETDLALVEVMLLVVVVAQVELVVMDLHLQDCLVALVALELLHLFLEVQLLMLVVAVEVLEVQQGAVLEDLVLVVLAELQVMVVPQL
jgi:hypothetical protein